MIDTKPESAKVRAVEIVGAWEIDWRINEPQCCQVTTNAKISLAESIAAALESIEKERDTLRSQLADSKTLNLGLVDGNTRLIQERDTLSKKLEKETDRANIYEEMERQASEYAESLKKQLAEAQETIGKHVNSMNEMARFSTEMEANLSKQLSDKNEALIANLEERKG